MIEDPEILRIDDEISLVPVHLTDSDALLTAVQDNLDELGEWLGWATPTYSKQDVDAFFETSRNEWSTGSARGYVIHYRCQPSGTIGLARLKAPARDFEIGYWLDRRAQGNGVVTKACRALLAQAFDNLAANLVAIHAAPGNKKSRAVATRIGMVEEARFASGRTMPVGNCWTSSFIPSPPTSGRRPGQPDRLRPTRDR